MSDQSERPPLSEEEKLWNEFEDAEPTSEKPVRKPDGGPGPDDTFPDAKESDTDQPVDRAAPSDQGDAASDDEALWANAPPDLKAAHDAQIKALQTAGTEHARRSIEGRIAAYTRRLRERDAAATQPPPQKPEEAADPLAELAAEYPEIAKPLQEKLAPIADKLKQIDEDARSRQEAADRDMDAELQANEQLLEAEHPGWEQYLTDNGAVFGAWIVDQPLFYRQAFLANQRAIVDPEAAILTIDAFKDFVAGHYEPPAQASASVEQQGLNPRRTAQLAGSAAPHTAGRRPTVSGIPQDGDEEAIWKAFAAVDPDERQYRNA